MKKIVLATGGFDPIHSGHINYFEFSKKLGDYLVIGLNSDNWLIRKKGKFLLPFNERKIIIQSLRMVNEVISFNDEDGTAIKAIKKLLEKYPKRLIIFANGGDRGKDNIPEYDFFQKNELVSFDFGVGGEHKLNSSSWILKKWENK